MENEITSDESMKGKIFRSKCRSINDARYFMITMKMIY